VLKTFEAVANASVPNIASHANAHSAKKLRINVKISSEVVTVFTLQIGYDL
jgi:hypothetical protein